MPHNSQTKKDKHTNQAKEIERLEAKVKRLQLALAARDAVLSQFANSGNWEYEPAQYGPEGRKELPCEWYWVNDLSPQDIATQALGEGK